MISPVGSSALEEVGVGLGLGSSLGVSLGSGDFSSVFVGSDWGLEASEARASAPERSSPSSPIMAMGDPTETPLEPSGDFGKD